MRLCLRLHILAVLLALGPAPARATDMHDYGKDEYAIIHDGMAPNKRLSLAAHGDGDGGTDNFHVWLMAEPAHCKIVALGNIGSDNNLDCGPNAYHAQWRADSRSVAVLFRHGRHEVQLNLYRIEGDRSHLVQGPSLFRQVTGRDVGNDDDMRRSAPEMDWKGFGRFVLREHRLFKVADAAFARRLGAYDKVKDRLDDGASMVEFAAEADCVLLPGNRYRILGLRVGKSGE
jgi:hypothetical protein